MSGARYVIDPIGLHCARRYEVVRRSEVAAPGGHVYQRMRVVASCASQEAAWAAQRLLQGVASQGVASQGMASQAALQGTPLPTEAHV